MKNNCAPGCFRAQAKAAGPMSDTLGASRGELDLELELELELDLEGDLDLELDLDLGLDLDLELDSGILSE
jgi:hypothetical protein